MILKQNIIRLCTLSLFLVIEYKAIAQGWVVDEVSKENSGGIFSGLIGFLLLMGVIWLIAYIIDKNKDDHERRKKSTGNHSPSSAELKDRGPQPIIIKIDQKTVSDKVEEKQVKDVNELIPRKDSCYIYYRVINEKEIADIIHYSTIYDDGFNVESYVIKNEDIIYENSEHHDVNIINIRENGHKISKHEFEKWQKRINNLKLKLEQLFPVHKSPYGKEWKDGDYLYFPTGEVLAEINKKYAENNNLADTEESVDYKGPDFSLLHVTNADKESPEGFPISVSEDFVCYDNEENGPKSLKYYISYYDRVSLISREDYEKALTIIKFEIKAIMQDVKESL